MVTLTPPVCAFGEPAQSFSLQSTEGKWLTLEDCSGEKGIVVMFICNHCPYVKAILDRLVEDAHALLKMGIGVVAIMSNDPLEYPEDSFENMAKLAKTYQFPFPYLYDATQEVAKAYGAVCTPDFFGYNSHFQLQYRGRLDASGRQPAPPSVKRELVEAMRLVAQTGNGPHEQIPSQGCSIKWKE